MNTAPNSVWHDYPATYRQAEMQRMSAAIHAGECVSVVGLSGSGKSNFLGFAAHRVFVDGNPIGAGLADCNRLSEPTNAAFFRLCRKSICPPNAFQPAVADEFDALESAIEQTLAHHNQLVLFVDRFDDLLTQVKAAALFNNLRALRDSFKFRLSWVLATRHPLNAANEIAELFFANTVWLGALSESDALWNVQRYAKRHGLNWRDADAKKLVSLSGGYPSLLRAVCEAYAQDTPLTLPALAASEPVVARVREFWADQPTESDLRHAGLAQHPLLGTPPANPEKATTMFETNALTAKELLLLQHLEKHANQVCEKDDLIRAVWSEDRVFTKGVRDDSLAQLVRRLREKIEPNASAPEFIHTVAGRGYRLSKK